MYGKEYFSIRNTSFGSRGDPRVLAQALTAGELEYRDEYKTHRFEKVLVLD